MAAELPIGTIINVVGGEGRAFVIITPKSLAGIYGVLSPSGYFSSWNEKAIMREVGHRELTPTEQETSREYCRSWRVPR